MNVLTQLNALLRRFIIGLCKGLGFGSEGLVWWDGLHIHQPIILHHIEDFSLLVSLNTIQPLVAVWHLDEVHENLAGFQDFRLMNSVQEPLVVALSFIDLLDSAGSIFRGQWGHHKIWNIDDHQFS